MTFESAADAVSLSKLAGKQWLGVQGIQFLHGSSNDLVFDTEAVDTAPPVPSVPPGAIGRGGAESPPLRAEENAADDADIQIGN